MPRSYVHFNVHLQNDPDKEHLGQVTYIPEAGIDGKYYPYAVMPNYHQPIVSIVRLSVLYTERWHA